jgi:hypothetical protein
VGNNIAPQQQSVGASPFASTCAAVRGSMVWGRPSARGSRLLVKKKPTIGRLDHTPPVPNALAPTTTAAHAPPPVNRRHRYASRAISPATQDPISQFTKILSASSQLFHHLWDGGEPIAARFEEADEVGQGVGGVGVGVVQ